MRSAAIALCVLLVLSAMAFAMPAKNTALQITPQKTQKFAYYNSLQTGLRHNIAYQCTDVVSDGITNILDLSVFARHYNVCDDDENYMWELDFDSDGCTDAVDFAVLKKYWFNSNEDNYYCMNEYGTRHCPDMTGDGNVDATDLALLAQSYNKCAGDSGFNHDADFDGTGCVDGIDMAIFQKHASNPAWESPYC